MKYILLNIIFTTLLLAELNISCKNKIETSSIYEFSKNPNSSILALEGELDGNLIYGEIDPANSSITYYDNQSAICGGSLDYNRLVSAYCDYNLDACWEISLGVSGYQTIVKKEGKYLNNVIVANTYPCLPYRVSNVTVTFYDYDKNDIGFANFLLTDIEEENIINLTEKEARAQREYCPNLLKYIDEWETILDSQSLSLNNPLISIASFNSYSINEKLTSIESSLENLNTSNNNSSTNNEDYSSVTDSLDINPDISSDIEYFKNDVESYIKSSFNKYSNVFGFGGYGVAPAPVSFSLLGKSYVLFNVDSFEPYIDNFRDLLVSFSYIWGFLLTFRTLS